MQSTRPPILGVFRPAGIAPRDNSRPRVPAWKENPWPGQRVLQLACGLRPMEDATNHDRGGWGPWVDVAHDLDDMPWSPLAALAPFDVTCAYDLVEHIEDVLGFVNEIHALLGPGGVLVMRGAAWNNPASYTDVTHRHWFTEDSFNFFDRSTPIGDHYGRFYTDSLGRDLTEWRIREVARVNADPRWPDTPDLQWTMVRL